MNRSVTEYRIHRREKPKNRRPEQPAGNLAAKLISVGDGFGGRREPEKTRSRRKLDPFLGKEVSGMRSRTLSTLILGVALLVIGGSVGAHARTTEPAGGVPRFVAALNRLQAIASEDIGDSDGRGVCQIELRTGKQVLSLNCEYNGLTGNMTAAEIHVGRAGENGQMLFDLVQKGATSGSFGSELYFPEEYFHYLYEKSLYIDMHTSQPFYGEIRGQIKLVTLDADADGDARTDAYVCRPNCFMCEPPMFGAYTRRSTNGSMAYQPFPWNAWDSYNVFLADFDGDGIADTSSLWAPYNGDGGFLDPVTVYYSSRTNSFERIYWGLNEIDHRAYGDYDGDGKIDAAVFRWTEGIWYILQSSNGEPRYEYWGTVGDQPCPGDYDKDGKADLCVVRDENGQNAWYIKRSSDGGYDRTVWGLSKDTIYPLSPVDVDADGVNDLLVSRIEDGRRTFYALQSSDNSWFVLQWGLESDSVRLGDFDGDGKTDFAAVRPIADELVWLVYFSSDQAMHQIYWGKTGDE